MYPTVIIVDEFYPDPHQVRERALKLDYPAQEGNYPGRNSRQRLHIDGLDQAASDILGQPVTGDMSQAHAQFRITLAGDQAKYHVHVDTGAHCLSVTSRELSGRHRFLSPHRDKYRARTDERGRIETIRYRNAAGGY